MAAEHIVREILSDGIGTAGRCRRADNPVLRPGRSGHGQFRATIAGRCLKPAPHEFREGRSRDQKILVRKASQWLPSTPRY